MSVIVHYGIKGMQKGKRRWTNPDGTLNEAGKTRYANRNLAVGLGTMHGPTYKMGHEKISDAEKTNLKKKATTSNVSRNASLTKQVVTGVNTAAKSGKYSEGENVKAPTKRDAKVNDRKRLWKVINAQSKKNKGSVARTATRAKAKSMGIKVVSAFLGKKKK